MHIVIMTRGIKHHVERFMNELSAKYLPFKQYNKEKKELEEVLLQMRVSPIQLWDISFPADQKQTVINTLFPDGNDGLIHSRNRKFITVLRKVLGLKPIDPKTDQKAGKLTAFTEHTEVIAIGEKPDRFENGQEMI